MTNEQAYKILHALEFGDNIPLLGERIFLGIFQGKVYSKGRPRAGRSGHFFTPENTRKFEKEVREWIEGYYKGRPVDYPVAVAITLYDPIAKSDDKFVRWLKLASMVFSGVGDIDNRAKAILDAANEVLFIDDKLVVDLRVMRQYEDDIQGFRLEVRRHGFSAAEVETLKSVKQKWDKH